MAVEMLPVSVPVCCPFCGQRDIFRSAWYYGMWACRDCSTVFRPLAALPRPDWLRVGLEAASTAAMVLARAEGRME